MKVSLGDKFIGWESSWMNVHWMKMINVFWMAVTAFDQTWFGHPLFGRIGPNFCWPHLANFVFGGVVGCSLWGCWGCRRVGCRRVGGPKGWGPNPEKVGARRVGAQNFVLFFLFPATVSLFLCLSGRRILVVFEAPGAWNVHIWALGLSRETPASNGPKLVKDGQTPRRRGGGPLVWRRVVRGVQTSNHNNTAT